MKGVLKSSEDRTIWLIFFYTQELLQLLTIFNVSNVKTFLYGVLKKMVFESLKNTDYWRSNDDFKIERFYLFFFQHAKTLTILNAFQPLE